MTPTADLMKLVEKWREDTAGAYATGDKIIDARTDGQVAALHACADELAAALSSTGEARVGGEVEFVADICGPCSQVFDAPHDCPLATPAQPASECDTCGGSGYTTRPSGNHTCWKCATPAQPKASEDEKCQRCREWATMGVGDGSGNLFVHGTYDAIKACQRQLLHPKASEGKAGGEDGYKAAYEAMVAGVEKALDEIEDAGPKALKYAEQELRAALQAADATLTAPGADDGL